MRTRLITSGAAALTVLAATATFTALAGPAVGADEPATCNGLTPTIVGGAGESVDGTTGDDVVIATNSLRIHTLGGDDTICYVGQGPVHVIDAGDGDDYVSTSQATVAMVSVALGRGADTFVGGAASERVSTGVAVSDEEVDRVTTGSGADRVNSGHDGVPNADVIHLGSSADRLVFDGQPAPGLSLDGATGPDQITVLTAGMHLNLADEVIAGSAGDGALVSFERVQGTSDLVVIGSDKAEHVRASSGLDARMGGGNDWVEVEFSADRVVGGAGRDEFRIGVEPDGGDFGGRLSVDLRTGKVSNDGADFKVATEHVVAVGFLSVRLVGSAGANQLSVLRGCSAVVDGRAGSDTLSVEASRYCRTPDLRAMGGSGDDELGGSRGGDVLIGGLGRDRANGRGGRDTCVAEVRSNCERV